MNVSNTYKKFKRFVVESGKSFDIPSKINNSGGVLRKSTDFKCQKIEKDTRKSEKLLLREVTPGKNNASFSENQLSLCSETDIQPIALFEEAKLEKSEQNYAFETTKLQSEQDVITILENRDHNYGVKMNNRSADNRIASPKISQFHNYSYPSPSQKDQTPNQITNIRDLKKNTPRVKLLNQESPTLQPLKKVNSPQMRVDPTPEDSMKKELKKYCRTCAGIKLPLTDIFSEKGIQMKLSQQIRHLENIKETDSLSTQMCMDCICDLKMSYTFFMQIKKAENKLKSIQAKLLETAKANWKVQEEATKMNHPLIQHDPANLKNNGPRISAVFSTKDSPNWETDPVPKVKCEPGVSEAEEFEKVQEVEKVQEAQKVQKVPSDNESLEEFDPDDPPFHPPSGEENAEGEPKLVNPVKKDPKKGTATSALKLDKSTKADKEMEMKEENLKRKLSEGNDDKLSMLKAIGPKEAKLRKLNVNEALNIKKEENGVMYVTVRGAKPNELLLVKVKKMEKGEKSKSACKKESLKEKENPFVDRSLEQKGQIIEEQIEEYKKKREKVLGPSAQNDTTVIMPEDVRVKKETFYIKGREVQSDEFHQHIPLEISNKKELLKEVLEIKKEKPEKSGKIVKNKEPKPKVYNNPEDYNLRIETVKNKWEDKQRKDWEEAHPGIENPVDRLKRILGDLSEGENLQEFIENLQQRKMVIAKLCDDDIVAFFKDRINARKLVSEPESSDLEEKIEVPFLDLIECDFCFLAFATKEVCDEHMKIHDKRILHYCEDCNEEFPVLRLKKNHNVICIRKLICKYCDLMLDSKGKKRQHEQKHCDNIHGQLCEYCGEKFKHQGTLDQHVKSRHMSLEKIFQCPKCPKKFAFKTKLSFHLKSVHTALRAFLCEDCGADFKNPASLRHHRIRKHQPSGNKKECPVCRKLIPLYSLSKHMHTHKAYTIKCPHCDKMFKNTSTLKQHVRIHEDQRQFRCDTCGVGFNRRDGLRLHMKVHEKSDSRGLKECACQICGEKFPNHSMLVIHRNRVHKDGRNYTCHICNRSMISTRSLEWHLAHIHNESLPGIIKEESDGSGETKRVCCFHCDKTFKTEMILRTHIKNAHMEKEPVKCLDCDLTFTSEVRLRHHMMVTHNRLEGTLQCPHCPKRFVNQLRLKTHMISHSEERPYTCEICGFNLKTKIQLIKHHQNRHSDERPLQCRHCPWRCKQVSALVCHERTHTNERPYFCSVCRQRFKYLGDKNKHERRHEALGGAGFKRIITTRGGTKRSGRKEEGNGDTSNSEQDQIEEQMEEELEMESRLVDYEVDDENVKLEQHEEGTEDDNEYSNYQQDYEETSREASDATEVMMSMEDTAVYTEEVTAENAETIETTHIIEDEIMANEILQSGTVVHIEQHDEEGKIQVIPVVLSLPDLTGENSEVNLATASIMYNNEECN
ncbi:uncharacterized protein LOC117175085 [Belonocnema kinseyi]|uniref:uncharacterized protein LOC117175085 n=1 Tax=Belonocnema kinseyi TaxID=2817044 RepID=UPI00143D3215|nr:uncharacterized protein LOC117175085 [Belonocnema kinseyi]